MVFWTYVNIHSRLLNTEPAVKSPISSPTSASICLFATRSDAAENSVIDSSCDLFEKVVLR